MMTRPVLPLILCLLTGLALAQDDQDACEDEENGEGGETTTLPTSGNEPERQPADDGTLAPPAEMGRGEAVENPCWRSQGLEGYAVYINRVDLVARSGLAPTVFVRGGVVQNLDQHRKAGSRLERWIAERFEESPDKPKK